MNKVILIIVVLIWPLSSLSAESNGFVSYFHRVAYENFINKEAKRRAEEEARRWEEERVRREAEIKRREEERRLMTQQVVKVEDLEEVAMDEPVMEDLALDPLAVLDEGGFDEEQDTPPEYLLQGVVVGDDWKQAIINGKVYRIGDKIDENSELAKVEIQSVTIRYKEQLVEVLVPMMRVTTRKLDDDWGQVGLGEGPPAGVPVLGGIPGGGGVQGVFGQDEPVGPMVMNMIVHE